MSDFIDFDSASEKVYDPKIIFMTNFPPNEIFLATHFVKIPKKKKKKKRGELKANKRSRFIA